MITRSTDSCQTSDLFTRECTNKTCEFQNGHKIVDKDCIPKDELGPCVFCGSQMKWFKVASLDEDSFEEQLVSE